MAYKTRCTRNEDGSYALAYGKGSKQLASLLAPTTSGKQWATTIPVLVGGTKREAIEQWGAWAASAYAKTPEQVDAKLRENTSEISPGVPQAPLGDSPEDPVTVAGLGGPPARVTTHGWAKDGRYICYQVYASGHEITVRMSQGAAYRLMEALTKMVTQ